MAQRYQTGARKSTKKFEVLGKKGLTVDLPLPLVEVWEELQPEVEHLTGLAGLKIIRAVGIEPTSEHWGNSLPNGNWAQLGSNTTNRNPHWGFRLPQRQLNQQDFGGSVWESNPPFDPRRTESPALKAGKITGPFSPPLRV